MTPALRPDLLSGKVAWITGGGTGLGRAMALRFAALGAKVAVSGRREEPLREVARETGGTFARSGVVRDPASVEGTISRIEGEVGLPDILVNNAAGNFLCPSEQLSPNAFASVVGIVLHGTFHCTQALARRWIAAKRGGAVLSIATTYVAARQQPAGLILYASLTSVEDMARLLYPALPARLLVRYRYDTWGSLACIRCPVLILHSPADEIIPFSHAQALYAAANEPKRLLELRGGHNDALIVSREVYARGVAEFLAGLD